MFDANNRSERQSLDSGPNVRSETVDHLICYEASLEKAFGRTLAQLQRAQQLRKGLPLPPQLDVKIT
jgi:hypothetical protein